MWGIEEWANKERRMDGCPCYLLTRRFTRSTHVIPLLAHRNLVVVLTVTPKEEYVLVGQRNFATQILVFFPDCERVDPLVGYTGKEISEIAPWRGGKAHSNKSCIPAVFSCLFDKVTANHKITSLTTADSAVLHNWPIQLDDWLNDVLMDIEAHC